LTDWSIGCEEERVRAGAVQLTSTEDVEQNLATADRLVRRAANQGAELVCLPEKWTVLGGGEAMRAGAQTLDGPALSWARETARELGIDLVAGSFLEADGARHFNTSAHVGPDGQVKAVYRKLHLFDVEIDGTTYSESRTETPGEEIVLSRLADGTSLGLSICYDLRFPELFRILTLRGAEVIVLPSAFTVPTTRDHWEILVRARAIENQVFVVAPNQIGTHGGGFRSGGRSLIVDPWGLVLGGAPDAEDVVVAELDLPRVAEVRQRIPALSHRRPEVYDWSAS
jgi:predicted amidohydrolase